jgi:hypothetical protein
MQRALPICSIKTWRLAPFIIVSLLVHVALLNAIRLPISKLSAQTRSMSVNLVAQPLDEQPVALDKVHRKFPESMLSAGQQANPNIVQPDGPLTIGTSPFFNTQQLLESSKIAARDEARKIEQHDAMQEKKRLMTPAALLEQYLRLPHKEIRLANGTLKIITSMGEICFQPVPYFARDNAAAFALATTCP